MSSTVLPDSINLVYTESNLPIEFLDIHTEPSIVHVGDSFRINATVINNTPNTITFKGLCDSPLSAVFNSNVIIEHGLACQGFTIVELKSGEKTSVVGPSSGIVYRASNAGMTNARITFTYAIQDESTSVSKPFAFTIREGTQNLITAKLNTEFHLEIGQTALIESKNISVRFLNVTEDSRCPSDVVCVWEGQVTILLNIMQHDQDLGDFALTIRGGDETLAAKTFDGHAVQVMQVEPYPKASEPIQTSDYVATLVVSKISSSESNSERVYVKAVGGKSVTDNEVINFRLLGSWNLEKGKGIIVIFADGERDVWHLIPRITNCMDLIDLGECIISPIIMDNGSVPTDVRLEVDKEKMQLFMVLPGKLSTTTILNIKEVKTWSANGIITAKSTLMLTEGQRDGPLLVRQIYPDRIEGLNFIEYPLAREEGIPTTLHIGETTSNGCTVKLTLLEIHDKVATFLKTVDTGKPCPICWHDKS
ncbi:MAG: hypothetical protein HMLIMOIP_000777 [Candidatus Nitrosomirales archaeon]|jgi:hypothetical protein